ncbi:ATP-dependent rRNA helicase spb4 [Pestalotiopsis sp. IQ-011]
MASSSFTFVNTTDGPSLSRSAAKKMRAHITKTNFEKRRQRLRQDTSGKLESHRAAPKNHNRASASHTALGDSYRMLFMKTMLEPVPKDTPPESFGRFWSLAFLDGGNFPQTDNEKAWAQLICSEPSLLQTTLAIGVRHWAPDAEYQQVADECWSAATNIMIQHISSGKPCTDAVLGTVMTMAFGERLVQNEAAWEIHIDGLAKMISHRFEHGERSLPSWLYDLLIT